MINKLSLEYFFKKLLKIAEINYDEFNSIDGQLGDGDLGITISKGLNEINNNFDNVYTPMYFNAYDLFKKNKLLGVGVGSFLKKSHKNYTTNKEIDGYRILPNPHPHQHHFEILASLGLPGYIFIFLFLFYFLSKSIHF